MSRSQRLLDLLQLLRSYRRPVGGAELAAATGVSLRTLYRDIATLQAQGANIEGEAGVGYVLRPGYLLPPLMFSEAEIEALVLGSRWVAGRADGALADAARAGLAKIAAVLPKALAEELDNSTLLVGPGKVVDMPHIDLGNIRDAIRSQAKIQIDYADEQGRYSRRIVWPFALAFFDQVRVLLGWCELRQDYRSFRADRISSFTLLEARYPKRREVLLKGWRQMMKARQETADRN
ncbi:helix-turn-helix transcriptional regulator [Agrobacterium larrymoorei]|uniref:DNA-binding transcriptional regulator YafY n=1 Tax=Agrobacterium larrymoorei TaxID=160699 RepID=A0ABU0UKA8_9HYPH|nr:YafY family protein [Agrobacterium larrymoorei]MDQ1185364.1 putative DNA-binding transcriptional regulator YafY [Agrobacterium larrymoorei]